MKLARCARGNAVRWCVVTDDHILKPFAGHFADWSSALMGGDRTLPFTGDEWSFDSTRFLPPVERGSTVYVAGANFTKHLREFGIAPPQSPFAFLKPYRALTGAFDDIPLPRITQKLDFEAEMVAVIGRPLRHFANPHQAVLGYTVGNDISARDLQKGPGGPIGMDFLSGKGLEASTPMGPWIVTRDEFGDATPDLRLSLTVNGEARQDGRTAEMTWDVGELMRYVDSRVRLEPGDVLFTGTPAGVGQGDGRFLKAGDIVETSIERIGALRNRIAPSGDDGG